MNLQFIKYFVALAESENFTRAAERVHVVQSTFSSGIKKLEENLGTKLFDRDKRNVNLTKSGEALFPRAKQLLSLWYGIEQDFKGKESQILQLGFIQNISLETIMPYTNNFKQLNPLTEVYITEDKHFVLLKMLDDEKLDFFFTEEQQLDTDKFKCITIASEKLYLAVNHKHSLAKKEVINLSALHEEHFIERSHCALYDEVYEKLNKGAIKPKKVFSAHNNETVAALVSSGIGITLMPKPIFLLPEVKFLNLSDVEFIRKIVLVYKKGHKSKALNEFLKIIKV